MSTRTLARAHQELADIDEVAPLSEADQACFDDLRKVLKRHNALSRFGISLLHRHFEIYEGEVLVEVCDKQSRTLTLTPVELDALSDVQLKQTNWRLDRTLSMNECISACVSYCVSKRGTHQGATHDREHE